MIVYTSMFEMKNTRYTMAWVAIVLDGTNNKIRVTNVDTVAVKNTTGAILYPASLYPVNREPDTKSTLDNATWFISV